MPNVIPDVTPNSWQLISQTETTAKGPDGQIGPGVMITFMTGAGHQGSVFLPWPMYTKVNARAAIAARAALMDDIGAMTG